MMPAPAEASPHDTEDSIDEQIASLKQVNNAHAKILNLRARRNASVPFTARLPTETLAQIFVLFQCQYRHELLTAYQQDTQPDTSLFGWLTITHVCRHWRSIARALPHLWSHVHISFNAELIKMFLGLSQGVPLSILPGMQVYEDELQPEIFSLLIPEASRIRSLRLFLSPALFADFNCEVWDAPLLESIDLEASDEVLPPNPALAFIQDAALPALRSLSLMSFTCSFARRLFRPTLTSLVIRDPESALPIAEWVNALDGLPLLEHLVLADAVVDEGVLRPVTRRVEMVHLTHIELRARNLGMQRAGLLDHLVLPACRTLALTKSRSDAATAEECRHVFSTVASALRGRFAPRACELRLYYESVAVHLWQETLPAFSYDDSWYEDGDPSERPQVTVDVGRSNMPIHSNILPILVSSLPLADVRTLRFWQASCDLSLRPLSSLQKVETLVHICEHPTKLLQALSEPQHDASTPLLFPTLRHLTLRQALVPPSAISSTEPNSDVPLSKRTDSMLVAREEMGAPLHELRLEGVPSMDEAKGPGLSEGEQRPMAHFPWDGEDWNA